MQVVVTDPTKLQAIRDLAARAEAAEAKLRRIFDDDGFTNQTSVCVSLSRDASGHCAKMSPT